MFGFLLKAKYCILFLILVVLLGNNNLFAAEKKSSETDEDSPYAPLPVIKISSSVKSVRWNRTDTSFAYSENRNIFIRDAKSLAEKQRIQASRDIRTLKFADYGSDSKTDQLLSFSEDNVLAVRVLPNPNPSVAREFLKTTKITALEFSDGGTYIGLGTDSGQANLYMQLYMTGELSNRMLLGHTGEIYSAAFSRDGKFMATASTDGSVRVWDTMSGASVSSFVFKGAPSVPISFAPSNDALLLAQSTTKLSVRDLYGRETLSIDCPEGIRSVVASKTGNAAIVLTSGGDFRWISLADGSPVGHIPAWSAAPVTCFDFSRDGSRLLVGCADGSIYIVDVDSLFVLHGQKAPLVRIRDVDDEKKQWLYDPEKKRSDKLKGGVTFRTSHNIEIRGEGRYSIITPYDFGMSASLGYVNDYLLNPFYIGALLGAEMFFPNGKYPSSYYHLGKETDLEFANPYLLGYTLTFIVGREWKLKTNPKWAGYAELVGGGSLKQLSHPSLGSGSLNSALHIGAGGGFTHKSGLRLYAVAAYDTVLKFNVTVGVGYKARIWKVNAALLNSANNNAGGANSVPAAAPPEKTTGGN